MHVLYFSIFLVAFLWGQIKLNLYPQSVSSWKYIKLQGIAKATFPSRMEGQEIQMRQTGRVFEVRAVDSLSGGGQVKTDMMTLESAN